MTRAAIPAEPPSRRWYALASVAALVTAIRLQEICREVHRWCICGHNAHHELTTTAQVVDASWVTLFALAVLFASLSRWRVRFVIHFATWYWGVGGPHPPPEFSGPSGLLVAIACTWAIAVWVQGWGVRPPGRELGRSDARAAQESPGE